MTYDSIYNICIDYIPFVLEELFWEIRLKEIHFDSLGDPDYLIPFAKQAHLILIYHRL